MFAFPRKSQSFILRVWVEPREIDTQAVVWRGTLEAVGSEQSASGLPVTSAFGSLDELLELLSGHLEELGIPKEQLRGGET